jgi:predicted CXXCH cytochrome family protein
MQNRRSNIQIVIILLFILFVSLNHLLTSPEEDKSTQNSCLSNGCHSDLIKNINHEPMKEDCRKCHQTVNQNHPEESGNDFRLVSNPPDLCLNCHQIQQNEKSVHTPVAEGLCLSCHNPHSSEKAGLLKKFEGNNICYSCHDLKKEISTNMHDPVEKGQCGKCHEPHNSKFPKLLKGNEKELCLQCHNRPLKKDDKTIENIKVRMNSKFVHAPVSKDECSSCHNPHGSPNDALVIFEFHNKTYVYEREKSAGLCFSCHSEEMLSASNPEATNFKNGNLNLHFVHVNREKARNCTICHDIHGSNEPKQINQSVKFGKWMLPINFKKSENGGSCSSGCHKTESYHYDISKSKQSVEAKPGLIINDTTGTLNCDIVLNAGFDQKDIRNLRFYLYRVDSLYSKQIELNKRLNFKIQNLPFGEYLLEIDKKDLSDINGTTENPVQKFRISGSSSISTVNIKYFINIVQKSKNNKISK